MVLACGLLTYGGVSLFVVVFAVYPFAAEMFRAAQIPKRLVPPTIALGAFTFTMDALPITLTGVCERVDSIRVDRIQDARVRRLPFQQKIGAGLTREQFQKKVDDASVRHVGLAESVSMIADAMGWKLDRITDEIHPKIATATVSSEFLVTCITRTGAPGAR